MYDEQQRAVAHQNPKDFVLYVHSVIAWKGVWFSTTVASEYIDIAVALSKSGDCEQALLVAERSSDTYVWSTAFWLIALAYAGTGYTQKLLAAAGRSTDDFFKSTALEWIVAGLAKSGDYEQALLVADGIPHERHKASALCKIAVTLAHTGNTPRARVVLQQAEDLSELITDEFDLDWVLVGIAPTLARLGDHQQALAVARRITGERKAYALSGIADALAV